MSESNQVLFARAEFLELANRAGFQVSEQDLDELLRRNLLRAWEPRGSRTPQSHFHRLHLFALARYFDAVRSIRHPWGAVAPEVGLSAVAGQARECRDLVGLLAEDASVGDDRSSIPQQSQALAREWAQALRERAAQINPFGPLQSVPGLLSEEARAALRGDGLLFLVFTQLADALEMIAGDEVEAAQAQSQTTELSSKGELPEVEAPVAEAPVVEAPVDEPPQLDTSQLDARETLEQEAVRRENIEREIAAELSEVSWGEDEVTKFDDSRSQQALDMEAMADTSQQAEAVEPAPEIPNGFAGENVEATSRTEDLQTRLARLRSQDASASPGDAGAPIQDHAGVQQGEDAKIGGVAAKAQAPEREEADIEPETPQAVEPQAVDPQAESSEEIGGLDDIFDEALEDPDFLEPSQAYEDETSEGEVIENAQVAEELDEDEDEAIVELEDLEEASDAQEQEAEETVYDELQARTDRLNELRQTYLAEQRWEDLVELYEDGLDLFSDPLERQRVFLTLALLYDVKLKRPEAAFERFAQAYALGGDARGVAKAFDGMQRLGRQSALHSRWSAFLEAELGSEELAPAARANLQRHHALVLHALGSEQRAFYTYTAFLADAHPEQLDARAFDELERLAEGVGTEELGDIYADLLANAFPDPVFEPLALRAARHHADAGEVGLAMEYYERVLARFPAHEVAFHNLAQLYEDAARWVPLKTLYQTRIELSDEGGSNAHRSELARIEALMGAKATSD